MVNTRLTESFEGKIVLCTLLEWWSNRKHTWTDMNKIMVIYWHKKCKIIKILSVFGVSPIFSFPNKLWCGSSEFCYSVNKNCIQRCQPKKKKMKIWEVANFTFKYPFSITLLPPKKENVRANSTAKQSTVKLAKVSVKPSHVFQALSFASRRFGDR